MKIASMMRYRRVFKVRRGRRTENNGVVRPLRRARAMEVSDLINGAATAFAQGKPVMVFDSDFRECETDLLWPAAAATPAVMRRLRQDCGGLLFLAIGDDVGEKFGLPWLQDIHTHPTLVAENPTLGALITDDLQYDTRSAFTLSLNHRDTYTGITDHDRALTTRRFGELAAEMAEESTIDAVSYTHLTLPTILLV